MKKMCKIRDLQRAVNKFETNLEKLHGICLNEGMALCTLSDAKKLSSGELGSVLGLTPSNTSKILRAVEQKGLVARELGSEDKRQMYFSLTGKGRQLLRSIDCEMIEAPEILQRLFE
ncbi:MarR family transcriptional regulator [uncultured Alistipes sp.]|jgi:transcriptional regulator|uniref:MarR family transcriptional regulator n=1 Tax=uncultured Alistipes sp. TaxID=538949 RepID=UPI0025F7CDEC|nr:MarR family transcriptional regulator [uncultured Alistipes sp.]